VFYKVWYETGDIKQAWIDGLNDYGERPGGDISCRTATQSVTNAS